MTTNSKITCYRCDEKTTSIGPNDSETKAPNGRVYVCTPVQEDNTNTSGTGTTDQQQPEQPSNILDTTWDYISNWLKDADIWDGLKALATLGGIIWYGSKLLDQFTSDGESEATQKLNGTTAIIGSSYSKPVLRNVVERLCLFAGISYDLGDLSSEEPVEFTIAQNTSARTIIEQLSQIYNFDIINSAGTIKFKHRYSTETPDLLISKTEMGFSTSRDNLPDRLTTRRGSLEDIPRSITLTYFSDSSNHEPFTQKATDEASAQHGKDISISVPFTLSHQKAKDSAELLLTAAQLEAISFKFNTSYKYIQLEPGDIVQVAESGQNIRINRVTEGNEGILEFEGVVAGIESNYLITSGTAAVEPTIYEDITTIIPKSAAIYIDPLYFANESITQTRIYGVVHGFGQESWPGANVYMSRNGGASFTSVASTTTPSVFGVSYSPLGAASTLSGIDTSQTVTVTIKSGTLTSITDTELLAGTGNLAFIGRELIAFGVATLVSDKVYTLSRLRRGLNGTENFVNNHVSSELFAPIDTLVQIPLQSTDIGQELLFKTVSIGGDLSQYDVETVGIQSNNQKLYMPKNLAYSRSGNDFVFTWTENIRKPLATSSSIQHDIHWNSFAIAILSTSGSVISRHVVTDSTFTYTAAQQLTDWGSSTPSSFKVSVVPISTYSGPGYPAELTI